MIISFKFSLLSDYAVIFFFIDLGIGFLITELLMNIAIKNIFSEFSQKLAQYFERLQLFYQFPCFSEE